MNILKLNNIYLIIFQGVHHRKFMAIWEQLQAEQLTTSNKRFEEYSSTVISLLSLGGSGVAAYCFQPSSKGELTKFKWEIYLYFYKGGTY